MARRSGFHCLRLSLCYFRGRVQHPWQVTRPLSPFPRQLWSSVYYLLLVLCAHELITPDCLIICPGCFSFPLQWETQTMLYLQAFWAALRICLNSRASQFYEGAVWSDASVSRWATNEFFPGGLTSDNQFVNSLLSSQGEKPSPDVAGKTGSWSAGKWVLIHWATASGSYPKLPAFIRRLQIWRITSNWKLMHFFFLKREALNLKWCGDSALRYLSIHYLLCVP